MIFMDRLYNIRKGKKQMNEALIAVFVFIAFTAGYLIGAREMRNHISRNLKRKNLEIHRRK